MELMEFILTIVIVGVLPWLIGAELKTRMQLEEIHNRLEILNEQHHRDLKKNRRTTRSRV